MMDMRSFGSPLRASNRESSTYLQYVTVCQYNFFPLFIFTSNWYKYIYRLDFLENVPFLQYVHGTLNLFLNDHTLLVDTGIGLGRASPTFCRSRAII